MAIYSLSHKPIGKSTQREPHTASAHIAYITRDSALDNLEARRMPGNAKAAGIWLREAEDRDRKNARVADKIMLALPRELTPEQRVALVRKFAEDLTKGRASWLAAFHENRVDASNPHCHLVLRDRDVDTGKRVIGTSEKGSTERIRIAWETHANAALEEGRHAARVDRRTLEKQGIRRKPTIHEGVRARRMRSDGRTPVSRLRRYRNGVGARQRTRNVNYADLDRGRTRHDVNREIEASYWAELDQVSREQELNDLRLIHHPPVETSRKEMYRNYLRPFKSGTSPSSGQDREHEPDD